MNRNNLEYEDIRYEDISKSAQIERDKGSSLQKQNPEQAIVHLMAVINHLKKIPDNILFHDHRINLGAAYGAIARLSQGKLEIQLSNFQAAIDVLTFNPEHAEEIVCSRRWMHLGFYQCGVAEILSKQNKFQEAITYTKEGIKNIQNVKAQSDLPTARLRIVQAQIKLGAYYRVCKNLKEAKRFIYSGLNLCLDIKDYTQCYSTILHAYQRLRDTAALDSQNKSLYLFAEIIFGSDPALTFRDGGNFEPHFLRKYFAFLETPPSRLHQEFLLLLQLIENSVDQAGFPNAEVKTYLSDPENRKMFREKLKEIKDVCDAFSLVDAIGESAAFTVNVAVEMKNLKAEVRALKQKVECLEAENQQLKSAQKESIYAAGHTTFPASSSQSVANQLIEPSVNNNEPSFLNM